MGRKFKITITVAILLSVMVSCVGYVDLDSEKFSIITQNRWSEERIANWYNAMRWPAGCNYNPANSINQLEFWQEDTFSPDIIDKELALAEEIGFTVLRTYLHDLA